jgi:hypothetical protein
MKKVSLVTTSLLLTVTLVAYSRGFPVNRIQLEIPPEIASSQQHLQREVKQSLQSLLSRFSNRTENWYQKLSPKI